MKRLSRVVCSSSVLVGLLVTQISVAVASPGGNTLTNPIDTNNGASVNGIVNSMMNWGLSLIGIVAAAMFLFHLYKLVMVIPHASRQAQRREEMKAQIVWVLISGVGLGAIGVIASALFSFGKTL